eukprot:2056061-Rhodomonas_salina.1
MGSCIVLTTRFSGSVAPAKSNAKSHIPGAQCTENAVELGRCDEISFECCGPWIPLQEKAGQTALRQKRMEELMQEGAQQARKVILVVVVVDHDAGDG